MKFPGKSRGPVAGLGGDRPRKRRTLLSATVATSLVLSGLPAYSAPSSNPALPSGADTFSPPIGTGAISAGVPAIATINTSANPGDTLTLTGSAYTNDFASDFADTRVLVYGQTNPTNGQLQLCTTCRNHFG